jgi:hypothetical protein
LKRKWDRQKQFGKGREVYHADDFKVSEEVQLDEESFLPVHSPVTTPVVSGSKWASITSKGFACSDLWEALPSEADKKVEYRTSDWPVKSSYAGASIANKDNSSPEVDSRKLMKGKKGTLLFSNSSSRKLHY